ncbi:hypothetical protein [Candidatus Spongiihabitans sp.]|uniref:hypothetical protein n=1 Tax=Candidatus Spongiihabitans sp. TaxID=3101308 RepID=UPI003C7A3707
MAIHAIVLQSENDEVSSRITAHYPNVYAINDKCFLVRSDDVSEKVAEKAGLKGDEQIEGASGVVLKLNGTYAGFAPSSVWEWLAMEDVK